MKYTGRLKLEADTYYCRISKTALFFTALFAVFIMYIVYSMNSIPELAVKYYFEVPRALKNLLLICATSAAVGLAFEVGTN